MNATSDPTTCGTEAMNALLRGEVAAVESYTQALEQFDDEAVITDLQKIRDEHSRAVRALRDQVIQSSGTPTESPGSWGEFAPRATASVGPAVALAALRVEEEHGASAYEAALENDDVPPDCQRAIRLELLPACRAHVEFLNRMLGGMNR